MDAKQIASLLIAAQMLSSPVAQALSLSQTEEAPGKATIQTSQAGPTMPHVTLPTGSVSMPPAPRASREQVDRTQDVDEPLGDPPPTEPAQDGYSTPPSSTGEEQPSTGETTQLPVPTEEITPAVPSSEDGTGTLPSEGTTPVPTETEGDSAPPSSAETPTVTPGDTPETSPGPGTQASPSGEGTDATPILPPDGEETGLDSESQEADVDLLATGDSGFNHLYMGYGYSQTPAKDEAGDGGMVNEFAALGTLYAVEKDPIYSEKGGWDGVPMSWLPKTQDGAGGYVYDLRELEFKKDNEFFSDPISVEEVEEKRLGRIPDYQFDGWWVFGWGFGYDSKGTNPSAIDRPTSDSGKYVPEIPCKRDLKLKESLSEADMAEIRNTIVDSKEKASELTGHHAEYGEERIQDGGFYEEGALPLIAHWKLSSDASLVETAPINAIDITERTEKTTALTAVTVNASGEVIDSAGDNLLKSETIKLYDADPDQGGQVTSFDYSTSGTYYMRVATEIAGFVPTLLSAEPFLSDEVSTDAGVTLTVRQAGETETVEYKLDKEVLNASEEGYGHQNVYNNIEFPMRSAWTLTTQDGESVDYIPLSLSKQGSYYNVVTATVTSPDGSTTNTYTFNIQRFNDPKLIQNPGNTPFGMIEREDPSTWQVFVDQNVYPSIEAVKAAAREAFLEGYMGEDGTSHPNAFVESGDNTILVPRSPINNEGQFRKNVSYDSGAWPEGEGKNVDLDPNAIVVYQDSAFLDPGFTIIDSRGEPISVTADSDYIKRQVTLRLTTDEDLGLSLKYLQDNAGEEFYYDAQQGKMEPVTGVDSAQTFQVVRDANGMDRIDLQGAPVIPGIYQIEYCFTDPTSGESYSSDPEDFMAVNAANADTFRRTLVILPIPGDVDMDGAVTASDAEMLRRALLSTEDRKEFGTVIGFLDGTDDVRDLYYYRVCDVNHDGVVDDQDVRTIQEADPPRYEINWRCDYFYLPLPTGNETAERYQRKELTMTEEKDLAPDDIRGRLSLDFLGLNTPEISATPILLNDISTDGFQGLQIGDEFWIGVKISDLSELYDFSDKVDTVGNKKAICGGLAAMRITIAYDSEYLEPVLLPGNDSTGEEAWKETIRRYNIAGDQEGYDNYRWTSSFQVAGGSLSSTVYSEHYSKAKLPLESSTKDDTLREMTIFLQGRGMGTSRILTSDDPSKDFYYLIRVPFRLKSFPFKTDKLEALDLGLGMRDLTMFSYLLPQEVQTQVSAAWTTQDGIYGDATRNLAEELVYVGGTGRAIPLGEDKTERITLENTDPNRADGRTVYGEYFTCTLPFKGYDQEVVPGLPKGLEYDNTTGIISGIPAEVSEVPESFEFQIPGNGTRTIYRIYVEKADLTLYADNQERYYGEENKTLGYKYKTTDIRTPDLPGGLNFKEGFVNNGVYTQLQGFEGFQEPLLTTSVNNETNDAVARETDAGSYEIKITSAEAGSGLKNYQFVYADTDASGAPVDSTDGTSGVSTLTVLPRPLRVEKLVDTGSDSAMKGVTVSAGSSQTVFRSQEADYSNDGAKQFELKDLKETDSGLTETPVYSDDVVTISFTARIQHENATPPYFNFQSGETSKQVEAQISEMTLIGDTAKNYVLLGTVPTTATAKGTVTNNPVVKLVVENPPKQMSYMYGEHLGLSGLKVTLTYEDGTVRSYSYTNEESFSKPGIMITWEDKADGNPHRDADHQIVNGQSMEAAVHHGKFLCVSIQGVVKQEDGSSQEGWVCWYSEATLNVTKVLLTLTAVSKTVYYGEFDEDQDLAYTYRPDQLSQEDRDYLLGETGKSELAGTMDELEKLPGYTAPIIKAKVLFVGDENWDSQEDVTADTPVSNRSAYIVMDHQRDKNGSIISGTSNYSFAYTRGDSTGDPDPNRAGYSTLEIKPRPIVVTSLTMSMEDSHSEKTFLYDDTTQLRLEKMYYTNAETGKLEGKAVTAAGRNPDMDDGCDTFLAATPKDGQYYPAGTSGVAVTLIGRLNSDPTKNEPIHRKADGTLDQVVLTYQADYKPDDPTAVPPGSAHFQFGEGVSEKLVQASIQNLTIDKEVGDGANYVLVFDTRVDANTSRPQNNQANGLVKLRELESMTMISPASRRDNYVYGEQLNLNGMSVELKYVSEGDNDPTMNQHVINRTLNYQWFSTGSSFGEQGLKLYWLDPKTELPDLNGLNDQQLSDLLGEPVESASYPDVAKTGKKLIICGHRSESDPLVWAETDDSATYTIIKKAIPLTVAGQDRFYGEPNGEFSATFFFSQLARPDQDKLKAAGMTGEKNILKLTASGTDVVRQGGKDVTKPASSTELSFLDSSFVGPAFTTDGGQGDPVGKHNIDLVTSGAVMANYTFVQQSAKPGTLQIFRRPIVVNKVCQEPISTIYNTTKETNFAAYAEQKGQMENAAVKGNVYTVLPNLTDGMYRSYDPEVVAAVNTGMSWDMPLTGNAIYGDDTVGFTMTVVFRDVSQRNPIPENQREVNDPVTIQGLDLTTGVENYYLVYNDDTDAAWRRPEDRNAIGRLDRRTINQIEILQNPTMEYTYGETLDLSKLVVRITYDRLDNESANTVQSGPYIQFSGRLSINYWDSPQLPVNKGEGETKPVAAQGDHLTRAPDHKSGFVHNGKYLILTARAHETTGYTCSPVLVSDPKGNPVPITVNKLDLTYTLAADGKVYDGTTDASGAITLTNVYSADTVDGAGNRIPDRDLIYVVTGTDKGYEGAGNEEALKTYLNDAAKDKTEAYTFPSDSAGLKFTFFDANVKYADDRHTASQPVAAKDWLSYWNSLDHDPLTKKDQGWDAYGELATLPVLVSGLTLAGPDAENYKLDPSVGLADNSDPALHKDTVPFAQIDKAERTFEDDPAIQPLVTVDAHTNAVRLLYIKDAPKNGKDAYDREVHYEYALQYEDETDGLQFWGGDDPWQDSFYFGGEKVECTLPEGYVPGDNNRPSAGNDKIEKGQTYRWSRSGGHWYDVADDGFGTREALDRGTVYWGAVRMAETHNYKASNFITSAVDLNEQAQAAQAVAQAETEMILAWVEKRPTKDVDTDPEREPAPAVKTYDQRLDLISTVETTGADKLRYSIDTLESVWFTDIVEYEKKEMLDAVVRNQLTTRYFGYFWDQGHSAALNFTDGIDLKMPITVEINERQPDGKTEKHLVTLNNWPTAKLYVGATQTNGNNYATSIEISPRDIQAELGDESVKLTYKLLPGGSLRENILWTSSNPNVAQVTDEGEVIFVGAGMAIITATTDQSEKSDSIFVFVTDPKAEEQGIGDAVPDIMEKIDITQSPFDFGCTDAIFTLDDGYYFHPEWHMERSELVSVLGRLYRVPEDWSWDGEVGFPDLTGEEPYIQVVAVMADGQVVIGLPDTTFAPALYATRAEMAALLCRMIGLPISEDPEGPHAFQDAGPEDTWAWAYIDALAEVGVVKGENSDRFAPNRPVTRAEAAAMIGRALSSGVNYAQLILKPLDVPESHWGYAAILRAINSISVQAELTE